MSSDDRKSPFATGTFGAPPPDRDPENGRFRTGNQAALGHATRQRRWRAKFHELVTPADFEAIVAALVAAARAGDIIAIREVLLKLMGRDDNEGVDLVALVQETSAGLLALVGRFVRPDQRHEFEQARAALLDGVASETGEQNHDRSPSAR